MIKSLGAVIAALCLCTLVRATTVIAPSFDELVQQSELVFRGRITGVRSDWTGEGEGRRIATWVTFAVERTLRGTTEEVLTLEFIGGEVAGRRLRLAGFPVFELEEHGVFFVESRTGKVCPLMRLRHGRYRVMADKAGIDRIVRDDNSALTSLMGVRAPLADETGRPIAALETTMTLESFEAAIIANSANAPLPAAPAESQP